MILDLIKRRGAWWLFAAVLALGAFVFRYPALDKRPMHADEAVHAVKLGILLETGEYVYNPHEYHGPAIYYAAVPFAWATGATKLAKFRNEKPLRVPIVICGALLVLAVALTAPGIGRLEAGFGALLLATSPAFSFYSRYYIQEVPFTLFGFLTLVAGWKLLATHRVSWAILFGAAFGVMVALKETWILVLGAAGLTSMLLHLTSTHRPWPLPFPWRHFAKIFILALAVALFTGLLLLSNFFRNMEAIPDVFTAIGGYISRGVSGDSSTFGANVHDHPWHYYLQLLIWPDVDGPWLWTEGATLVLGCVGIAAVIISWETARRPWHFIALLTILLTAFYSAIPYKTPWNVLPMLLGWCLLAGRGMAALVNFSLARRRWAGLVVAVLLLSWPASLAVQSWRATIKRPADIRNPYAYSATSPNIYRLAKRALQLAEIAPEGRRMLIQIVSPANDYWPLPWYLRRFKNIGYYTDFSGLRADAAMIISAPDLDDAALSAAGPRQTEYYGLRPEIVLTTLIRQELWDQFMARQMKLEL